MSINPPSTDSLLTANLSSEVKLTLPLALIVTALSPLSSSHIAALEESIVTFSAVTSTLPLPLTEIPCSLASVIVTFPTSVTQL